MASSLTQRIYLDNAATTCISDEVLHAIIPYMQTKYGNPSSIHSFGREVRMDIEMARKSVAQHLGALPGEIVFTSGGTESINAALVGMIESLELHGKTTIVTSPIEHHATLHTIEHLQEHDGVEVIYMTVDEEGNIILSDLENILKSTVGNVVVCLMAANNEIGTLYDIKMIGELCKQRNAIFICDMVQWIGHYPTTFSEMNIHFATASGHKFHAPKGIGFLYMNSNLPIKCTPYIHGGSQERRMRAGTENVCGVIGMAKALDMQTKHMGHDSVYIKGIKKYMEEQLQHHAIDHSILGNVNHALYSVLNVAFPLSTKTEMISYRLDMEGIAISSGSACSSGTLSTSHVIHAIGKKNIVPIRFSFSKYTTKEEIDITIHVIKQILL